MYKKLIVDSGKRMLNSGLTVETWGNISARDAGTGLVYLTPSVMSYELSGTKELAAARIKALGKNAFVCLPANHGAVSIGVDIDSAFSAVKGMEMTAQIYAQARATGRPCLLEQSQIDSVSDFASRRYRH